MSRGENKQSLINLITENLVSRGCKVINAKGDADMDIVKAALHSAEHHSTTVVGEDTDILVLLLCHPLPSAAKEVYFRSDKKEHSKHQVFHIRRLKQKLGETVCGLLPIIHAFTGCDSTSRIYGVGKKKAFQKLLNGESSLISCAEGFNKTKQTKSTIEELGNLLMVNLFSGKPSETLTSMRHTMLHKKVRTAKSFVSPERLPPTSCATNYHSLRSYYQTMVWLGEEGDMSPLDWGWRIQNDKLYPIMMSKKPAPDHLLKIIRCNCVTGCGTQRCSCRSYGLSCTQACGQCQDKGCENPRNSEYNDDDDDNDEYDHNVHE